MNRSHPGWGESLTLPDSDHLFHDSPTEPDSPESFQEGRLNPAFARSMKARVAEVMAAL